MEISEYLKVLDIDEWWNPDFRIKDIINYMQLMDFKNKKVLDIGSRFGIFTYQAILLGAAHVTGIELEQELVSRCCNLFDEFAIGNDRYDFICGDINTHNDWLSYDVILFLGMYYNTFSQEELLWKCKNSVVLLESWTEQNRMTYPITTVRIEHKVEEHGLNTGDYITYFQPLPNRFKIEKAIKNCGFRMDLLRNYNSEHDHCDVFYLLNPMNPGRTPPHSWGLKQIVDLKL